ncbi:sodium/proton antiporter (CPA1 family) [Roseiarcus fermentans]|uniref:Sodium/proton antiporter (CPA1 family) n=1 Tax=Roseiarcus fermentans TaxID=1473586 RepID=A0A366EYF4_9HYPH|nr:sodium:proton antiporter [Roseiarcus fermentans]RBP07417.1 sodium/proton antiporter (CPA1 family) [Roseiarcus fermentans]
MDVLVFRALGLLGLAILVALAARRLRLPYTVGLVLAGAALAFFRVDSGLTLTHDLIFDVVLPPLLFEAALNIRWGEFRRDLVPVLALSTVGVLLCAAAVASGLVWGLGWQVEPALAFGALIAATDPIAVVALLRETGVTGRIRLLIEAESLVNDGAAAVLFTLVLAWAAHDAGAAGGPLAVVRALAEIAGGGVLVGVVVGLAAVAIAGASDDHLVETALTAVAAFGSFLVAERLGASGVLATVAAGIVMGNLGVLGARDGLEPALTPHGRTFVLGFWEFAAFLANSLVFLLIGSAMATIDFAREGWRALALAVLFALAGRAIAVYPVCLAFARTRWAVPANEQHLLWWGGLRGALALALALALPPHIPQRDDILICAFAVVAFSVIVQGLTAPFLLRVLKIGPPAAQTD